MTEDEFRNKEVKQEAVQAFLVIVCDNAKGDSFAIFSTHAKAATWADQQESSCVISPYVVDEPDWGNTRAT
jgi:hypothetical protein